MNRDVLCAAVAWATIGVAATACAAATATAPDDALSAGFAAPPDAARPRVWWHWVNGNVSRAGITADLESMRRVGLGGATIFVVDWYIPAGPVRAMSPEFDEMLDFAAREADRLGLELTLASCAGWSTSGGPWITPELAMQMLATSETTVRGPSRFDGKLPRPPANFGFYRDVAVVAFRTPAVEVRGLDGAAVRATTTSAAGVDAAPLVDGIGATVVTLPAPAKGRPVDVTLELDRPVSAGAVTVTVGPVRGATGSIQISNDGDQFRTVAPVSIGRSDGADVTVSLGDSPVTARFFRLRIESSSRDLDVGLRQVRVLSRTLVARARAKALFESESLKPGELAAGATRAVDAGAIVRRADVIDLTGAMREDGTLAWDVPEGDWTILRVGHTPTGKINHPAPPEATGLECDKLRPEGIEASWAGFMAPTLARLDASGLRGVVRGALIDSYEAGGQNWTPRMREEFTRRRGYDPLPFLPVMTGRYVESAEITERFLWDVRRTVADLFAENFYARFAAICREAGVASIVEPYGGPFETLQSAASADVPMAEFWAGPLAAGALKGPVSVAHVAGRTIVAAESFTGRGPKHAGWGSEPAELKPIGDAAFCQGINRLVIHRFAHQPWETPRVPGMTMGKWGINFERTNTWFELAGPWMTYLAGAQFLLQRGRPVCDVARFVGESVPSAGGALELPAGYDYDDVNADALRAARVVDGRIVLRTGPRYAILTLPPREPGCSVEMLETLRDLARAGATIVGAPPTRAQGLSGYPQSDARVRELVAELWGDCDGRVTIEHAVGKGRFVWGKPAAQVLAERGLAPDFETAGRPLTFVHRSDGDDEIYFVANAADAAIVGQPCTFRVAGKRPELWRADTGATAPAPAYEVKDGRTIVPLDLDPGGSTFVVFRGRADASDHVVTATTRRVDVGDPIAVRGPWTLAFPPGWGAPATVALDKLVSWPELADEGARYFSGTATYACDVDVPAELLSPGTTLTLDLGAVRSVARVRLNGVDLGILWKPPFAVDATRAARAGVNRLEVSVTNLWQNRMIGDARLPDDVEWTNGDQLARWPEWFVKGEPSPTGRRTFATWRHITPDMPLLPSGLLGPAVLRASRQVTVDAAAPAATP